MSIVAVTQRVDNISNYKETRDSLDQRLIDFVEVCDIVPLLMPNNVKTVQRILETTSINGVLLTGGNDTDSRVKVENMLIDYAIHRQLPILGICHGMQMIQQYFDVELEKIAGHVMEKQSIYIHDNLIEVNSFHDVGTKDTVSDLIVWAKATDGTVKAVYHSDMPIVGIMWHPERYDNFRISDMSLFKMLFVNSNRKQIFDHKSLDVFLRSTFSGIKANIPEGV